MKKHICIKSIMMGTALALTSNANAQGITGSNNGLEYFLYGVIAFISFALAVTIYLIVLKRRYQPNNAVKNSVFKKTLPVAKTTA